MSSSVREILMERGLLEGRGRPDEKTPLSASKV
jgi:hypothetical protein